MRTASLLAIVLVITGCAAPRMERATPPVADLAPQTVKDAPLVTEIVIVTPNVRLGAYTVEILYDPGLIAIDAIREGDLKVFPSVPVANERTFASGRTIVTAQTSRFGNPDTATRAHYHVATILWKRIKPGKAKIAARLTGLYDENAKPISGMVQLSENEIE